MDVLTLILRKLTLTGRLYFRTELGGAWSVRVPREPGTVRFHYVVSGTCWVEVPDHPAERVEAGDFILVPHGAAQILADDPTRRPVDLQDLLTAIGYDDRGVLRVQADQEPGVRLVCGFCQIDPHARHPVIDGLPPIVILRASRLPEHGWLGDALRLITYEAEAASPGSGALVDRLAEILFIQAVRAHTEEAQSGFVGALANPSIQRALDAFHRAPEGDWTVERLAREAGASRSRFAALFHQLVGQTPAEYLTEWRLLIARQYLAQTRMGLEEIAEKVGYSSVPAFSRMFSQRIGMSPGRYRVSQRAEVPAVA